MFERRACWCLAIFLLVAVTASAGTTLSEVGELYREGISHWVKGTSWRLEFSHLPIYRPRVLQRQVLGQATLTVLETPADGADHYLLGFLADKNVTRSKLYFVLDPNDLSLLEMRIDRRIDPNAREMHRYPGHNIREVGVNMVQLIFPVFRSTETNEKGVYFQGDNMAVSKSTVRDIEGRRTLVVEIALQSVHEEPVRQRLDEGRCRYRLLWKKGDPWWTSQTTLPDGSYRIELLDEKPDSKGPEDPNGAFLSFYNRWKEARTRGDDITADEYYYRLVRLGKTALPHMMGKIRQGDTALISVVSEITGRVRKTATKEQCLEWWQRASGKP
jgi:hypothetical protein